MNKPKEDNFDTQSKSYTGSNIISSQFDNLKDNEIDPNHKYFMELFNKSTGFTMVMKHAMLGDFDALTHYFNTLKSVKESKLIKYIINKKNTKGWTPLMLACRHGTTYSNIKTIKLLLDNGANVNAQSLRGYTTLLIASTYSNDDSSNEIVKLLLSYGADPNLYDINGDNPLAIACLYSNKSSSIDTVQLLIDAKSDINNANVHSKTALMVACEYSKDDSHLEVIKLLLKHDANVNIMTWLNKTAFALAFKHDVEVQENKQTLKLLLQSKTDIKLVINKKITAEKIIDILL